MSLARAVISGILLAAGAGSRFGGQKLLYPLADGIPIGAAAGRNLGLGVERLIAVVRPGDSELSQVLAAAGAEIVRCPDAAKGMGTSLACGVRAAWDASGWLIALADMPCIRPKTIRGIARLIRQGALAAAPCYRGRRGHPVGFGRELRAELAALDGDSGARTVLARYVTLLQLWHCDDPGVLKDVDRRQDIATLPIGKNAFRCYK